MSTELLIREYVRQVLKEDDGGVYGDLAVADAGMNPYGVSFGSDSDLYKVFVKPFVDVVDTTMGKTKELSQKAQTLGKVAFEAVATTLIPVLRDSYKEIFAHEKEEIDKIKQEYHDVYQANWDAFRDLDVVCTAFCYAPAAFLTAKMIQKSPSAAISMISVLTGGSIDGWLNKVKEKFDITKEPPKTGLDVPGGHDGGGHHGSQAMLEAEGTQPSIEQVLTNPKLVAKIQESPLVKKMERDGRAMVRGTLEQVFKQAQAIIRAQSLQDMQNKTHAKLKGLDKLAQVPPQERQKLEQAILAGAKKSMKAFYIKNLEGQVKQAIDAGISESSPYVQDYKRVIAKINGL
jgi:hypothetical protein